MKITEIDFTLGKIYVDKSVEERWYVSDWEDTLINEETGEQIECMLFLKDIASMEFEEVAEDEE